MTDKETQERAEALLVLLLSGMVDDVKFILLQQVGEDYKKILEKKIGSK